MSKPAAGSLELARSFLGREVVVLIDRPLGSCHPQYPEIVYRVNYGYIPGTLAPDGEPLDAYVLGIGEAVECALGVCVAVLHRRDDSEAKLVVVAGGANLPDEDIMRQIEFQERYFDVAIVRT